MTYGQAENILDNWEYHDLPDGERIIRALDKAKSALRIVQELLYALEREGG